MGTPRDLSARLAALPGDTAQLLLDLVEQAVRDRAAAPTIRKEPDGRLTISQLVDLHDGFTRAHRKASSAAAFRGHLFPVVRCLGDVVADELSIGHLEDYRAWRVGQQTKIKTAATDATACNEIRRLRQLVRWGIKYRHLTQNRIESFEARSRYQNRTVTYSPQEVTQLQEADIKTQRQFRAFSQAIYDTGCRVQEIRCNRIDNLVRVIMDGQEYDRLEIRETRISKTEKSKGFVYMRPETGDLLRALPRRNGWLLEGPNGKPYSYSAVRKWIKKAGRASGLSNETRCYYHAYRHSLGTDAMQATKNPAATRDMLRHASIQQTNNYVHPGEVDKLDSYQSVWDLRRSNRKPPRRIEKKVDDSDQVRHLSKLHGSR